jgi:uncharacterized protein YbjT (DUF2867 family)
MRMQDKEHEVVCITGSTGFVGRHVVRELCSRGLKVRCMMRPTSDLAPLGGPEYLTYEEIVDLIIDRLKLRRRKLHIPVPLMRFVAWTGEKLGLMLPVTSAQLAMLTRDNITSLDAVEKVFGFKPVSLREKIDNVLH